MTDTSDLDQQIEQLRKCEIIKESDVKNLCAKAREILGKCIFLFKTRHFLSISHIFFENLALIFCFLTLQSY